MLGALYIRYNDGNSTQWVPASPSASGPQAWRSLGVVNASNVAQVDFVNIPSDINHLMFVCANVVPVNNDVGFGVRFFDGTGTIDAGTNYYSALVMGATTLAQGGNALNSIYTAGTNVTFCYNAATNYVSNVAASGGLNAEGRIMGIRNSTTRRQMTFSAFYANGAGTGSNSTHGGGQWINTTSIISGVRFVFGTGNIASGTIELWGSA